MDLYILLNVMFGLFFINTGKSQDINDTNSSLTFGSSNVSIFVDNRDAEENEITNASVIKNNVPHQNVSITSDASQSKNDSKKVAKCNKLSEPAAEERQARTVEMINAVRLSKLLVSDADIAAKDVEGDCMAVLFFAKVCQFSCQAAPQYNALARAFPDVRMVAMDALKYHGINAQYGIVGVPTLKLFHNGKPIGKYNGTEYTLEGFVSFLKMHTDLEEKFTIVMPKDFEGPVPSIMEKELDYFLVISWIFIIFCGIYFFGKSSWWKNIVETVQNNWRESEAQHEHVD